jgi:rhamnosyltransferase
MPWLEESLRAVRAQRGSFELVEILAVDSGSSDGSLEALEAAGARVIRVPPEEFGHGRTRNLAAREACGDIVAFLTQDATPADDSWLAALIAPLDADPLLAGVWSRHLARSDCHPMERRTIEEFPLFAGPAVRVAAARGNADYAEHPELFVWFSNNAAAFPRSVLLRWPFPDVEFAEDQAWARLVLEAGFRTALANESRILHSHAYSAWTNLQRNFDHAQAMVGDLGRVDDLSLTACVRAAVSETRRDVAFWAQRSGRAAPRVAAGLAPRALAYHLGAFGGRWLGSRARRLPPHVRRWLSLHERRRAAR